MLLDACVCDIGVWFVFCFVLAAGERNRLVYVQQYVHWNITYPIDSALSEDPLSEPPLSEGARRGYALCHAFFLWCLLLLLFANTALAVFLCSLYFTPVENPT